MFQRLIKYVLGNSTVILAVVVALFGSYHLGYYHGKKDGKVISENVIAKYENKVLTLYTELLSEQQKVDTVIETVYVDRIKTVKEKEYVYVKQAADDVPATFQLSAGWVYLHDAAASGMDADASRSSDATPSGVQDNQGIGIVVTNYSECRVDRERLIALQDWINQSIKSAEAIGVNTSR